MSYLITAIVFILIFSFLILIHELGHFIMAKRAGIKVEEFGLGLPPRIWGKKKGETIYSINLIPFGGFVRMLGEDSKDEKMLNNKRSFIAQPMRARVKVIIAGVVMNFLLAYTLLTIGLTVGMEPLLMPNDIIPKTQEGIIQIEEGVIVKKVYNSVYGVEEGDRLFKVNERAVDVNVVSSLSKDEEFNLLFLTKNGEEKNIKIEADVKISDLIEFYPFTSYPRIFISDVFEDSIYFNSGLLAGDEILMVDGVFVFGIEDFVSKISSKSSFELTILRNFEKFNLNINSREGKQVVASLVLTNSPAERAGLLSGDAVLSANGVLVGSTFELIELIEKSDDLLELEIKRNEKKENILLSPENGKIGVLLGEMYSFENLSGISLYVSTGLSSIISIENTKYPFYIAPIKAFNESYDLSKLTAKMFVSFVRNFVSNGTVPDGVAGPVGIAQMTHIFVQDGFIAIMRFVALLSLSLAVINILPIPALDGGRLLFIIIELIRGKKVNQKAEAYIHLAGYLLVLSLIVAVTYSDIVRLFK